METEILTGEDIRFLAQQPDAEVGIMLGQMTTLMQNINDLQQDTDDMDRMVMDVKEDVKCVILPLL